jgi:hypothetical protein
LTVDGRIWHGVCMGAKEVENESYAKFCERVVKSLGDRVGEGDVEHLRYIRRLREVAQEAEGRAISGLLAQGYSYAEVGAGLGISRQAVHKAWVMYRHRTNIGN